MNRASGFQVSPAASAERWTRLLGLQAATCALYFALGSSSFAFALPPFYINVVWGATGAALAMVLVYGTRVIPGAVLGALLTNLFISHEVFAISLRDPRVLGIALLLSLGVGLHLWLTQWLLRRFVALDRLERAREITGFMLIAGPLGSIIGTTIGSSGYVLAGGLDASGYWQRWLNWWLCDTTGIVLLTPVLYMLLRRHALGTRRAIQVSVPLLLMLVVLSGTYYYIRQQENTALRENVARQSKLMIETVGQFMQGQLDVARVIRAHFELGGAVDREGFEYFSRTLLKSNHAIAGISWSPRVDAAERQAFERDTAEEFGERYSIRRVDGVGQASEVEYHAVYYPMQYVVSRWDVSYNRNMDWASTRGLGAFLAKALTERQPVLTPPVDYRAPYLGEQVFAMLLVPVLEDCGSSPLQLHSDCVRGFVSILIASEDVHRHAWRDLDVSGFLVDVRDRATDTIAFALGDHRAPTAGFDHRGFVDVVDRQWQIDIRPGLEHVMRRRQETWLVLTLLMFSGGLLGWVVLFGSGRGANVRAQVAEYTQELTDAREHAERRALSYRRLIERLLPDWRGHLLYWRGVLYQLSAADSGQTLASGEHIARLINDIGARLRDLDDWSLLVALGRRSARTGAGQGSVAEPMEVLDLAALAEMAVARLEPEEEARVRRERAAAAPVRALSRPLLAVLETLLREALAAAPGPLRLLLEPWEHRGCQGHALHLFIAGDCPAGLASLIDRGMAGMLLDLDLDTGRGSEPGDLRRSLCILWTMHFGGQLWYQPEPGGSRISLWLPQWSTELTPPV